jgi:hypothetical protein
VVAGVYWRDEVAGEEEEVQEAATRTRLNSKRNWMEEQMLAAKHLWSCKLSCTVSNLHPDLIYLLRPGATER